MAKQKILVVGASGFIGRAVSAELENDFEVFKASGQEGTSSRELLIDLLSRDSIKQVLQKTSPEVVINCAGIVDASKDVSQNIRFTTNLIEEIAASAKTVQRVIILGSAAEYGNLDEYGVVVDENTPLNPNSDYGRSKAEEVSSALSLGKKHNLQVVVARLFNPLGAGMNPRMLIPNLTRQVMEIKAGSRQAIELSRLDSARDYIDVQDMAKAIRTLVENKPKQSLYLVGSGQSTTNGQLLDLILSSSQLDNKPAITETAVEPEKPVASRANISRLKEEFGWQPRKSLNQTVKEIVDETISQ